MCLSAEIELWSIHTHTFLLGDATAEHHDKTQDTILFNSAPYKKCYQKMMVMPFLLGGRERNLKGYWGMEMGDVTM